MAEAAVMAAAMAVGMTEAVTATAEEEVAMAEGVTAAAAMVAMVVGLAVGTALRSQTDHVYESR